MKDFNDYAKAAIERCKLKSYYGLAKSLELSYPSIHSFKKGKKLPSPATMIKLSKLAGVPEEKALIDLASWSNADNPEVQKIWFRVSKMIGCVLLFLVFGCITAKHCYSMEIPQISETFNNLKDILCDKMRFIKKLLNTLLKYIKPFKFGGAYV